MSTTIVDTWVGTDISTLGPIYPMVGSEMILVIAGVIFWLGFHFIQSKAETKQLAEEEAKAKSKS